MKPEKDEYRKIGIMLFGVLAAAIAFYFFILRIDEISKAVGEILNALKPLTGGIAVAYILRPVAKKLELLLQGKGKNKRMQKTARPISVMVTMITAIALVTLFVLVVLPQVYYTLRSLINVLPGQIAKLVTQADEFLQTNIELKMRFDELIKSAENTVTNWITTDLLGSAMAIIGNVIAVMSGLFTAFITIIVSVYLLLGWEKNIAQIKKLFFAVSRNASVTQAAVDTMYQANRIFSGFITGKLIDSLIVGVLCFVFMNIFRMPYTLLISVIIGVTNIIPMFGPFIGAIPSAFLILLISPGQCLGFIFFILILQQVDGNVIGPRVLGDSTGLSALYVTIAMLLFSKLFGFVGMILGVPVFGIAYYLVKRFAEAELKKRSLSTNTEDYWPTTPKKK